MSTQLKDIEANIARNKEIVARGIALERLKSHADFRKIVIEGYLEREAIRLVHLKGDPNMQRPDRQLDIQADIDGIGRFAAYLNLVGRSAAEAAMSIEADEATREEIAAEELGQ